MLKYILNPLSKIKFDYIKPLQTFKLFLSTDDNNKYNSINNSNNKYNSINNSNNLLDNQIKPIKPIKLFDEVDKTPRLKTYMKNIHKKILYSQGVTMATGTICTSLIMHTGLYEPGLCMYLMNVPLLLYSKFKLENNQITQNNTQNDFDDTDTKYKNKWFMINSISYGIFATPIYYLLYEINPLYIPFCVLGQTAFYTASHFIALNENKSSWITQNEINKPLVDFRESISKKIIQIGSLKTLQIYCLLIPISNSISDPIFNPISIGNIIGNLISPYISLMSVFIQSISQICYTIDSIQNYYLCKLDSTKYASLILLNTNSVFAELSFICIVLSI
jgi:hypothetical protein